MAPSRRLRNSGLVLYYLILVHGLIILSLFNQPIRIGVVANIVVSHTTARGSIPLFGDISFFFYLLFF